MNTYKNTIISLLAVAVLVGVAIYLFKDKQKNNPKADAPVFVEVVQTESGEEEIELDRPLSQSFSNALSNNQQTSSSVATSQSSQTTAQKVVTAITKPFMLGFYYFNTINKYGVEECTPRDSTDSEEEFPEYTKENFRLTDVSFSDNKAYLFVDADESPEKICAQVLIFKNITTSVFDAINVIVE